MVAKVEKTKVGEVLSKSFYTLLKNNIADNAIYAGVSYVPDSEWNIYTGSKDSESTFWGGSDSEYGYEDAVFYNQSMYSMHKVLPGGVSRVIPRIDWTRANIYKSYPNKNSYVLTKDYDSGYITLNVYRCLFSPNTPSQYAPTGTSSEPLTLNDGYVWKYLYTISNSESLRFLNDRWMPVPEKIITSDFSKITSDSLNYNQYISQINAKSGEIYDITIDSDTLVNTIATDSDFRTAFNWNTITLLAKDNKLNEPSQTFKVKLNWDSLTNKFTKTFDTKGQGYKGPVSVHMDSDSPSIVGITSFVSPGEGHGGNIPAELNTSNVLVSIRNVPDDNNKQFYNGSLYNLLTLHLDPIDSNTNKIATNEFYVTCNSFEIDEPLDYKVGDIIKPYYNDDGRRGFIISVSENTAYYISTKKDHEYDMFADSEIISLENLTKIRTIKKTHERQITFGSSDLLIADYKQVYVTRNKDQIESFNFVLGF